MSSKQQYLIIKTLKQAISRRKKRPADSGCMRLHIYDTQIKGINTIQYNVCCFFSRATHSIARSLLRQRVRPSVRLPQPVLCLNN